MFAAEVWVAVSFICFIALFGKKIYDIVISMLDNYILEIENRINEAERLKDEAAMLLKSANERKENVKAEIEACKKDAEERMHNLKRENEDHITQVEKRIKLSLAAGAKADLVRKTDKMFKRVAESVTRELEALIAERAPKIRINVNDLDKLK